MTNFINKLDNYQKFILALGCLISIYSLYFFMSNKIYLIGSDAFYYMSIADSILESGEVRYIGSIPSMLPRFPQLGIVFVHILLSWLGLSNNDHIIPIVILNYFLYLSAVYPLYRIARRAGMNHGLPLTSLLAVYLGAWHIYRINLLVINDGVFNPLVLWLVYLIVKMVHSFDKGGVKLLSKGILSKLIGIGLLVIVLIQFRVTAGLIIGSALLGTILVRNYRATASILIVCALLLMSFFIVYSIIEVRSLEGIGLKHFEDLIRSSQNIVRIKAILWKILPRLVAGLSGLTNSLASLFFSIFPLSMIYYMFKGFTENNFSKVFIALICLSGLWFTLNFNNARVIWYIFPLIYLIILSIRKIKIIGFAFVLLVFVQSIQQFYIGFSRGPDSKLFLHIFENRITLPHNDPLLLTWRARYSYFHFDTRSYRVADDDDGILDGHITFPKELNWSLIKKRGSLFVLGDSSYINSAYSQVQEMASTNGYELESNPLTPDLNEFEGWALVEFSGEEIAR